jgi:hypothetical protein
MTLIRILTSALLSCIMLAMASCIDGREEVWLNADGSGRADIYYDIPASATRFHGGKQGLDSLIGSWLKDFPSAKKEVLQHGNRLQVRVKLDFKNPDEVSRLADGPGEISAPRSFDHLAGQFKIRKSLTGVDFTRTISPGKAFPAAFIPAEEFRNRKLTYILHLPVSASESSADRTENGGRTLIWEQPLASAIHKPIVVHFKAELIPSWAIVLVALLSGVASVILFTRFRRRTSR